MKTKRDKKATQKLIKHEDSDEDLEHMVAQKLAKKKAKKLKKLHKTDKQGANRFFEDEAEEGGSDSDTQAYSSKVARKENAQQYYQESELRRRTKGINEKLEEMERRAKNVEMKRQR